MIPFIDIHSHNRVKDKDIISHPTFSVTDDAVLSYPDKLWCGLHPYDSGAMNCKTITERLNTIKDHLIGIGEIGLDHTIPNDMACQKEIFECQFDYAFRNHLPVTIHCVKAYNDIVQILKQKRYNRVVIHSFSSHPIVALQLLDAGCYLSFSDQSLKSKKSIEAFKRLPADRLFLETDGEEGKNKNTIKNIYEKAASLRGVSLDELKKQIYNNYLCLIG